MPTAEDRAADGGGVVGEPYERRDDRDLSVVDELFDVEFTRGMCRVCSDEPRLEIPLEA